MRKILISLLLTAAAGPITGSVTACRPINHGTQPGDEKNNLQKLDGITGNIVSIISNKDNTIFYATNGQELFTKTAAATTFTKIPISNSDIQYQNFNNLIVDSNDMLFFSGTKNDAKPKSEVYKYDTKNNNFTVVFKNGKVIEKMVFLNNLIYIVDKTSSLGPSYTVYSIISDDNADQEAEEIIDSENLGLTKFNGAFIIKNNTIYMGIEKNQKNTIIKCVISDNENIKEENFTNGLVTSLTSYDNKIFAMIGKELFLSENNANFKQVSGLTANDKIDNIIIDDQQRIYFASNSDGTLYSATSTNNYTDFKALNKQNYSNINSLWYQNNTLLVGAKDAVYSGDTTKFE